MISTKTVKLLHLGNNKIQVKFKTLCNFSLIFNALQWKKIFFCIFFQKHLDRKKKGTTFAAA
jgi:hypothetical protein